MRRSLLFRIVPLLWLTVFLFLPARAADIRSVDAGDGQHRGVAIEGLIGSGDYGRFIAAVKAGEGRVSKVYIFSRGGSVVEAMKIGMAMRRLELTAVAPSLSPSNTPRCGGTSGTDPRPRDPNNCTCASAAFFVYIGGVKREGDFLAVHCPYYPRSFHEQRTAERVRSAEAMLHEASLRYMERMHVPATIIDQVFSTTPDHLRVLSRASVRALQSESLSGPATGVQGAGASEEERRMLAFRRYFGGAAVAYEAPDFSEWVQADGYLGRGYDELLRKEPFVESRGRAGMDLTRVVPGTLSVVSLSGDAATPRRVASVQVVSRPDPKFWYRRALVEALSRSWGAPSSAAGKDEWVWNRPGFRAVLFYEGVSSRGGRFVLSLTGPGS